jgi:DNA-binding GntR family transcriptional regulator
MGAKQERVYQDLRHRILSGRYGPGYRLVIDVLARELLVSSIPVREAVRRLEADGLVVYTRNVGFRVAERTPEGVIHTLETLAVLEGWLAGQASGRVNLGRLRELSHEMGEAVERGEWRAVTRLDREFHWTLVEAAANAYARDLVARVYNQLDVALTQAFYTGYPGIGQRALQEHWDLVETLAAGAPARLVEERMRCHVMGLVPELTETLDQV